MLTIDILPVSSLSFKTPHGQASAQAQQPIQFSTLLS